MKRLLLTIIVFASAVFAVLACHDDGSRDTNGDNNDNNNDDTSPVVDDDDDNDTSPVDDDSSDDDLEAPEGLAAFGHDGTRQASWLMTDSGWLLQDVPDPDHWASAGPSFFLDGQTGWFGWNEYLVDSYRGFNWTRYDRDDGWAADARLGYVTGHELYRIFAPDADHVWSIEHYWHDETDEYYLYEAIAGNRARHLEAYPTRPFAALYFVDTDAGLVSSWCYPYRLFRWEGGIWVEQPMPVGFEDGTFIWFELADLDNGWAVWMTADGDEAKVAVLSAGAWSEVAAPAGCEASRPRFVCGNADQAIVTTADHDPRLWDYRDGQWSCRSLAGQPADFEWAHALVLDDGRVFVVGNTDTEVRLYQVLSDAVTPLAFAAAITHLDAVHFVGDAAPRFSAAPEGGLVLWQ
jgi:hypothetical protein